VLPYLLIALFLHGRKMSIIARIFTGVADSTLNFTSGYATWFTAGGAIRIAHYDVIDDVITRKL